MADRYKKIEFKDFSGGLAFKKNELQNEFTFLKNLKINEKTKRPTLLEKPQGTVMPGSSQGGDNLMTKHKNKIFFVNDILASNPKIYSTSDLTNFAIEFDLGATCTDFYYILSFFDKIIEFGYIGGIEKIAYFTPTGGWTTTAITANAVNPIRHTIIGKTLYILTSSNTIYRSTDGITYTLFYDFGDSTVENIEEMSEFLYFETEDFFGRFENEELKMLHKFKGEITFGKLGIDKMVIFETIKNKINVFIYTEEYLRKIGEISDINVTNAKFLFKTNEKTYFAVDTATTKFGDIYYVDTGENIFKSHTFTTTQNILDGEEFEEKEVFFISDTADSLNYLFSTNTKYNTTGILELEEISLGEIVPIQLIVKHDPLPAGTAVKIYFKKDKASAWGEAVLTSDTDNAIKAKYNFPNGTLCDFAEFKIELTTTDDTKTPENVKLEFLYLPIGLENAK